MAKTKKVTKAAKEKLVKAAQALENFSDSSAIGDILGVTGTYRTKKDGSPLIFSLLYKTKGVGAETDAVLHQASTETDTVVLSNAKDSIKNQPIGTDAEANRKFLNIRSVVGASNLTTVPADLDAEFVISGGVEEKSFPIPPASFSDVGDQFILDISIFIF
jgi:hypothetical protein